MKTKRFTLPELLLALLIVASGVLLVVACVFKFLLNYLFS